MPGSITAFLVGGLNTWSHEEITERAIMPLYNEFFGLQRTTEWHRNAVGNIARYDGQTDLTNEFYLSAAHFDGENFYGAQERLKSFKSQVVNLMQGAPGVSRIDEAQRYLGRALHTLQDFYAHSNWIEEHPTGNVQLFSALGNLNTTIAAPPRDVKTCEDCSRNFCFQCEDILSGHTITTGYYGSDKDTQKPAWKCSHGGRTALGSDTSGKGLIRSGINKDTKDCTASPHDQYHPRAATFAVEATKEYLRDIKNLIGLSKMSVLLGGSPRLAFVVDTTGSMGTEIASIRQQILQIIDTRVSLNLPTTYILLPFNDPSIGTITTTTDPNVFRDAVNGLTAFGGGDCPEPINRALLRAFGELGTGGDILLFTDARPSDNSLSLAVGEFAQSSGVRLTSVFSGGPSDCPMLDSTLSTLSFDTGGQFFSLLPSEAGLIANLGDFLALPNEIDLFSITGFSSTQDQIYPVPVDSSMTRMILSVTGTGATNVVVRRPDNTVVQPTDTNVSRIALSSGVFYSITSPAIGSWSVTIAGSGSGMNEDSGEPVIAQHFKDLESGPSNRFEIPKLSESMALQSSQPFSIRVAGESTIDISSFDFVELAGRPGHEGYMPIMGSPTAGKVTTVAAKLATEGANTAAVELRSMDGTVLQTLNLQESPWPGDSEDVPIPRESSFKVYFGDVTVPTQPFQVYVTGQDTNGNAYKRLVPGVIRPQTVEIIAPPIQNLHPGQSLSYSLQVKNAGSADTFQLTAIDDQNFLAAIQPTTFSLNTNETKSVKVQVQVPSTAVPLTSDTLRFTVQGSAAKNSAIVGPITVDPIPALAPGTFTVTPIGGDGDAFLDPGEGASLNFQLINNGGNTASNIRAGLSTFTPQIVVSQGYSAYADLAPSASGTNLSPFVFYVPPDIACGQTIDFTLSASSEGNGSASEGEYHFSIQIGQPSSSTVTQSFTGPAVPIPDNNPAGVNIPLTVSGMTGTVDDVNFRIDGSSCTNQPGATTVGIDHTWVSDLVMTLRSPTGTIVNLIDTVGNDGDNFCNTILDDQTTGASIETVTAANAPFTGTFKPNEPLNRFNGENPNGVWTLNVSDNASLDVGNVRAFSLVVSASQYSCNSAPADTTAPSCAETAFRPGPPASGDITTQDTGGGVAAIHVIGAENVNVSVPTFTPGTTLPIVVTGTLINPNTNGSFEIETVDVAGNTSSCSRSITGASVLPPIFSDDFNDNSLNTLKWTADDLFSGFIDLSLPLNETGQRLEIGPLLQNGSGSHYRGIRTISSYDFTGAYAHVELVQPPSAATKADAMFTVGYSVDNYYRIYVNEGRLIGQKKIGGVKTTLFTLTYDSTNHRFLRIRHDANSNSVVLETAPSTGTGPGSWTQRYTETWNSAVQLSAIQLELKAGTSQPETSPPGTVIFDNFEFGLNSPPASPLTIASVCPTSGSSNGGTPVTIVGTGFLTNVTVRFGGVLATNVQVLSSSTLTAVTPDHALGAVDVSVTNGNGQSATLTNGYTYTSPPPAGVVLEDNFNDNCLDTLKWTPNNLFSGFIDLSLPLNETLQRLEIGPLLLNANDSHYRGIRTINRYDFTGAYTYVELVQPASSATKADAMFTVGYDVDNYYRIYVSEGSLIGLKKIGAVKTTLFTLSYDSTNHRFLRIRHDATTNNVVLETAPSNGTGPGSWTQRYAETWNSAVPLTAILFEMKGGTWRAETNAPGKTIFDSFLFSR